MERKIKMKVCPSCGKENKDSAKFCTGCGKSLEDVAAVPGEPAPEPVPAAAPAVAPATVAAPAPATPAVVQPQAPVIARSPAQVRFKQLAGSKLALIICIAFTVVLLCSIFTSVIMPASVVKLYENGVEAIKNADIAGLLGDNFNISEAEINDAIDQITAAVETTAVNSSNIAGRVISAISGNAVAILFAVSLWIIYGVARDPDSVCCGTTGLKIIRVLRTIGLVFAVILAVIIALAVVFGLFMSIREGYDEYTTALYIAAGVIAVIYLFVFLFLGGCVSTAKRYVSVSENRSGRSRISGFVGFILFVGGIFSVIGTAGWIAMLFNTGADLAVFAVSSAATAVYQFALSRFIGRSKKALKTV